MIVPRPHDRPVGTAAEADEVLETFRIGLPRWPVFEAFRRNPLLRASDRIEAAAMAVAVIVSLLAISVACALGTAVHDAQRATYAQQHHSRQPVTATITDDPAAHKISRTNTVTMTARWSAAGAEHTGAVTTHTAAKPGDHVTIWVDNTGALTDEPTPASRAEIDAVTAALFAWTAVTTTASLLLGAVRVLCNRIRAIGWQNGIDALISHEGHKPRQP